MDTCLGKNKSKHTVVFNYYTEMVVFIEKWSKGCNLVIQWKVKVSRQLLTWYVIGIFYVYTHKRSTFKFVEWFLSL